MVEGLGETKNTEFRGIKKPGWSAGRLVFKIFI
jgi:hypothetical protein